MESPRKNNDCYFYYYSTCTKGDSCTFRHEPSALGCETTCSFWKEGKCFNVQCNFRHMELRKNRKAIPCYWETQPGGCLKPHCPFMHQHPKHLSHTELQGEASDLKAQEINKQSAIQKMDSCAKNASQGNEKTFGNPVVDPLVVNFEEESDNESAPTQSPVKTSRSVKVKTLEEIRLEKVQAESAAYYSYQDHNALITIVTAPPDNDDLRDRIVRRFNLKQEEKKRDFININIQSDMRRKKRFGLELQTDEDTIMNPKRQKMSLKKEKVDISDVKIKTLDEIRAERARRAIEQLVPVSSSNEDRLCNMSTDLQFNEESEVSSTSRYDEKKEVPEEKSKEKLNIVKVHPIKRLKRTRSNDDIHKQEKIIKLDTDPDVSKNQEMDQEENVKNSCDIANNNELDTQTKVEVNLNNDNIVETDPNIIHNGNKKISDNPVSDSSRLDEVLLLDVGEFDENDTIKAEEDILKDIDELLNE